MMADQQEEQKKIKHEIMQLRVDLNRIEGGQSAKPSWAPQLESVVAVNFDRQLKKLEELNSPAKTQQVNFH